MSDELSQLMGVQPQAAPIEFKGYSSWLEEQPVEEKEPLQLRKGYSDYIRESYIKAGQYNKEAELEIQQGLYGALVKDGVLKENDYEGFNSITQPEEDDPVSFDDKVDLVQSTLPVAEEGDWRSVSQYKTIKQQIAAGDLTQEYGQEALKEAEIAAQDVVSRRYNDVKKSAVLNGELAFASIINEEGKREIIAGDLASKQDFLTALKTSKAGGVGLSDALLAQQQLETPEGYSLPIYKLKRVMSAADMIDKLSKEDESVKTQLNAHAEAMARYEDTTSDAWERFSNEVGQDIADGVGWLIGKATGGQQDERVEAAREKRNELYKARFNDVRPVVRELAERLNQSTPDTEAFSEEEVMAAYKQLALDDANQKSLFKFHEGEDVGKNIRTHGFKGPVVHPSAMMNEDTFNSMLDARPDINDQTKKALRDSREAYLAQSFSGTSELLLRSGVQDEWQEALIEGRQSGKKNHEILNDFFKDEKNYSEFKARAAGVGQSLVDSVVQLAAAVPAAFGAEWAKDALVDSAQRSSDRREVATLFGKDMGFGQDIAETIAPMTVDLAATTVLALATAPAAGTGAAAYQAARQGARLTAKGLVKGLTSSTFRAVGEEAAEKAAQRLVLEGLIKTSAKDISGKSVVNVIKAYNGQVAQRIGSTTAAFIPAATRSGAATYGSVYHTLSQDPNLSKEEIHDRALGAALGAGALTGVITSAFNAIGRGGVEDLLLRGLNFKQAKELFESLAKTANLSDDVFKKAVAEQLKSSIKKYQFGASRGVLKDVVDESAEEGLDTFLNSFVEDSATDQNTPMIERFKQSAYAAALGGVMGGGFSSIRAVSSNIRSDKFQQAIETRSLENEFIEGVTTRLQEAGSPLTASLVGNLLGSQLRGRTTAPRTTESPTPDPDAVIEAQDTGVIEGEVAPETEPAEPIELSDEAQQAIADRSAEIASLSDMDIVGQREQAVRFNQQRIERLQREIAWISSSNDSNPPAVIPVDGGGPKKPPSDDGAAAAAINEYIDSRSPQPVSTPDILNADDLIKRVQQAPEEDALRSIRQMMAELTEVTTPRSSSTDIDLTTIAEGFGKPDQSNVVEFSSLFTPEGRAVAASVDLNASTAESETAQHFEKYYSEDIDVADRRKPYPYVGLNPKQSQKATKEDASIEFDLAPFKEGQVAQEAELAEALEVINLAKRGYPVRFGSGLTYGTGIAKNLADKSDFIAQAVYTFYPPSEIVQEDVAETVSSSRKRTFFDTTTGKKVRKAIRMNLDSDGRGMFNNDPVVVSEMLAHGIPVFIPKGQRGGINPAFVVKAGYVIDVRSVSKDGLSYESVVDPIEKVTDLKANNDMLFNYSKLAFYPDGVEGKVLPEGARQIDPATGLETSVRTKTTFGELSSELADLLSDGVARRAGKFGEAPPVIDQMLDTLGAAKLEDDFRYSAIQSAGTEFLTLAHLFELRHQFIKQGARMTKPAPKGALIIDPTKRKRAIDMLSSRMEGSPDKAALAEMVAPFVSIKKGEKPSHTDVITQFIEDKILNNSDFDGNVMPTFKSILGRNRDRYMQQQRSRGVNEQIKATVSLSEEGVQRGLDDNQMRAYAESLGGIDPTEPLSEKGFLSLVSDTVDNAVGAIDSDSALRDALNDLAFQSVYADPDANVVKHVQNMSSSDLMTRIGQWMAVGNNATRPETVEFQQLLADGRFDSGMDLRNALKLSTLAARVDGNPLQDEAFMTEVQRQLSLSLGTEVTMGRAINYVKAMDGAMRRRLSRSTVRGTLSLAARDANQSEIERLGLVSGDSESVVAAIEAISETSTNANHKLVAELLLEDKAFIQKVGFAVGISNAEIAGEYVKHVDGSHSVFINLDGYNGLGLENVLLEEYVHAFLSDTLTKSPDLLTTQQQTARKRLEGIYQLARQAYANSGETNAVIEAGLENSDEFVANFLLDPEFQKFIKTLDTPAGQRGFFKRIIDALLSLFRKVTAKEASKYSAALESIIALSKTTNRATAVPFKQQLASVAHDAGITMWEASQVVEASRVAAITEDIDAQAEVEAGEVSPEQAEINRQVDAVIEQGVATAATEQESDEVRELFEFLKSRIPYGVQVVGDPTIDGAAAVNISDGIIRINPQRLMEVVEGLDMLSKRKVIDVILNEEIAHVASIGSLTQAEIDAIVNSLSDSDFDAIAQEYAGNNLGKLQRIENNLASDNPVKVMAQKRVLAEEKLRMHLQKATRGYTTEEDVEFWSSSPSLLAVLKRYIGGVLNRFMYNRRTVGRSGAMDAALFSVMQEMSAIQAGFGRRPISFDFDPDTPAEAIAEYARILNLDPFAEAEDLAEVEDEFSRLASSALSANSLVKLMDKAGVESRELTFQEDLTKTPEPQTEGDSDAEDLQQQIDEEAALQEELDFELGQVSTVSVDAIERGPTNNTINVEALSAAMTELNNERYKYEVIATNSGVEIIQIDVSSKRPFFKVDFSVDGSKIKIGEMRAVSGMKSDQRTGQSFSLDLMTALIVNNDEIGVSKITTYAAGSGQKALAVAEFGNLISKIEKSSQLSTVDLAEIKNYKPRDEENNGYYTWPSMGFNLTGDYAASLAYMTAEEFSSEAEYYIERALNKITAKGYDVEKTIGLSAKEYMRVVKERLEDQFDQFQRLLINPNTGKADLMYALHGAESKGARTAAKRLWRMFGAAKDVEFSLKDYSKNIRAYVKRFIEPYLQKGKIDELVDIIQQFKDAKKELKKSEPEIGEQQFQQEYQNLRDQYNQRLRDEGIIDQDLFTSAGRSSSSTSSFNNMDFSSVVQLLELPMFEYEAYRAPKGWFIRLFKGDLGTPVKALVEQREGFKQAATNLTKAFKTKMDRLIKEAYGDPSNVPWDLIAKAQGYIDGNLLDPAVTEKIDNDHSARLTRINNVEKKALETVKADDKLDRAQKKARRQAISQRAKDARKQSRLTRDNEFEAAEDSAIDAVKKDRDLALDQLLKRSPDLASHIIAMRRELIEPIQKKLIAAGIDPDIAIKIDKTGGIYITRAYAMFNDPTFAERVRTDPSYEAVRQKAMKFFTDELHRQEFLAAKKRGDSDADANKAANKAVRKANKTAGVGKTYGEVAMEAFLSSYDSPRGVSPQLPNGMKTLVNNLKQRKDIPKELRDLLGEYGAETGTDLIVRTFATVASVAAQQTFLNNLATVGKQQGFLVTAAEKNANPDKYGDYVEIRKGDSTRTGDPLNGLYAPPQLVEALDSTLNGSFAENGRTTAERVVGDMAGIAQKLTGKAMLLKTVPSLGFHFRNMLGNLLFFGPSQGFVRLDKMLAETIRYTKTSLTDPDKLDAYLSELSGLRIIGDELRAGTIRELLNGKTSPQGMLNKLDELTDQLDVAKKGKKGIEWLEKKATDLSAAIDGAYKIAYYEHELNVLIRAARRYPNSELGQMMARRSGEAIPYEFKRMAAEKVLMTAQSLSQAPPLAKALTNSGFGLLFAPFIRFMMEVPRITLNTYRLGIRETKSDNPAIRKRGAIRMGAMSTMLFGFSMAVPAALSALSGVDDEEDEALRKSMPEYLRGHSFFLFRLDGKLHSLDLTYLNPFSLLADPFMRAMPFLTKGDVTGTVGALVKGLLFDSYLDDQILAGNVNSALKNRDATTGEPIWIEGVDNAASATTKAISYVMDKSYTPRPLEDMWDAYKATKGEYQGFFNSPSGELLSGVLPVKVHQIDLQQQYRRFVYDHLERLNSVNKKKYILYSKKAVDPKEIGNIYREELEGRRALNQELLRIARGFESLGIPANEQYKMLKGMGVGKDRARLLFYGVMDRPSINKKFAQGLIERGYGERLQELIKAYNSNPRYMNIEDGE